jgi:DNA transposition AAA+ family ATPase
MIKETHKTELQEAILEVLGGGMSQNELASKMDISPATIIAIKKSDWEKLSDKMLKKCRDYFGLDKWAIRNTKNLKLITQLCEDAIENQRCLAVAGYTGAGKTTALEYFVKQNSGAFYALAKSYHKPRTFLQAIQKGMGISDGYSIAQIVDQITTKMINTDNCLLIIDDAGKLTSECMRLIQCIYDDTEGKAGIVLAGTEYLKTYIDAQAKANVRGFRELKRRISFWQGMKAISKAELINICKDYNIVDRNAINYIYDNADNYKVLSDMIMNSLKIANRSGEQVSREMLVDLRLGDYEYMRA